MFAVVKMGKNHSYFTIPIRQLKRDNQQNTREWDVEIWHKYSIYHIIYKLVLFANMP